MQEKQILFAEKYNFLLIANPYSIWNNRFFDIICPVFYKYFWNDFNLKFRYIDDLKKKCTPFEEIVSYFLHINSAATCSELFIKNKKAFDLYPKIYIGKNPYRALADEYLYNKISLNQKNINSNDFLNYIQFINCDIFTNSYYTHSKENECLIDYIIFPESLKQDISNFYRIYRKFKEIKAVFKEFDCLKNQDQIVIERIKDNKDIALQDLIEKTGDLSKSGNHIFYKKLYTQEIVEYLKPYFHIDFLNYRYCFDM